ncbi:hypothetical protein TRIATDRAFT_48414 [Trichoderma atroviride IMI 206040]|uniref:Uncharacterized protein n=1 Tax=Hypocrea atroviridis (strain ATCC 20476 / IMI 206040) TaxID=452589 RepID=G9PCB7_HYPAI|nr:uncharacterized protein TRIATDRAFT_48414 [Trichoderma atroviride IMI 206040]EHK39491.1 hypothetical protein TRIATDRAFT_48414 [Trichoderma atroviride IMI 206040]
MSSNFVSPGGLASRRGSQNIKPLSFDTIKQGNKNQDGGIPTPRTSRSHLLAGLRTAPKSAAAASFGPMSPTGADGPMPQYSRNAYGYGQGNVYNPPLTAFPQYGQQHHHQQQQQQQQHYANAMGQQYTVDQVLAPPQLSMDEQLQEQMDPNLYAQLVATNMYLAQQQQRLQQQLRSVQAAAQQFQQLNIGTNQLAQQQAAAFYEQQQHLAAQAAAAQGQQVYYDSATGQYYVDTSAAKAVSAISVEQQPMTPGFNNFQLQMQMMQQQSRQQQQQGGTPRVQVSPPPEGQQGSFRGSSPPRRFDSPTEVTPLPPPSANAFRRGHKKSSSLAVNSVLAAAAAAGDAGKSPAPKTATFPAPATGGYGPGQARAGEHPIRQPRGPPSMDELKSKPTAKHEGSKNFATRTRRSAVHNLVRAGLERRKGSGSSSGSMSPVSETAEESATPITDNESDSGRSGSGSLAGEVECRNSRASAAGGWGAIGSDRPGSRQKVRGSVDSNSGSESDSNSFADVFKNGALRASKSQEAADGQRKAPRLVLTSVEKRKMASVA